MTTEHTYKGERIVRSQYAESKRWRIVSNDPRTGGTYWEVPGEGYRTLADARAAIDEAQAATDTAASRRPAPARLRAGDTRDYGRQAHAAQ